MLEPRAATSLEIVHRYLLYFVALEEVTALRG
jgi:hypothetical protein